MNILKAELATSPLAKQWSKIEVRPHHGILTPLSALHTKNSCGIGEFLDLIPLIDWCQRLHLDFLQLLPLNNAETDSSPYHSESSCALNPIYLSLWALPDLETLPALQNQLPTLQALNASERVLFRLVTDNKITFLKEYYERVGAELLKTKEVQTFVEENSWIHPYALFKTLKAQLHHTPWREWPSRFQCLHEAQMQELYPLYEKEMGFYCLLQYLSFKQLKEVKRYAESKQLLLMGDLPILLSQESVDNWRHIEYFDPYLGAGAPPDQYSGDGQNWGLPIFNWETLKKDQFSWWKQRFKVAENFFDLFRIDHILGFFRMFAIPFHHKPQEGSFIPDDDKEAEAQGRELLSQLIPLTQMLPIGEDLGMTPPYARAILKTLGICGTRVLRWERDWEGDKSFIPVDQYEPLTLSCVSTHDSETLTLWWRDFPEDAQVFAHSRGWVYTEILSPEQREEILKESHHSASLFHANLLQEYLALFPELVHVSPEEERINVPGISLETNWTYRYKLPLEQIVAHKGLVAAMRRILDEPRP